MNESPTDAPVRLTTDPEGASTASGDSPADASLARDARELLEALNELIRVYQFRDRKCICCNDISVTQCYALRALVRSDEPLPLGALADELYLDASTASRVVATLERKGYALRVRDPDDGRGVRITVTPEGMGLYARIDSDLVAEQERLLADFAPEVRRSTARLIARLAQETASRVRGDESCS